MNTATAARPPRWYWVVSGLAVLWMLFGVLAWFMDLLSDEASMAQMSEAQRQLYASRPQWLFIVYAVAIFSGLVGTLGLLLRKAWATAAFDFRSVPGRGYRGFLAKLPTSATHRQHL